MSCKMKNVLLPRLVYECLFPKHCAIKNTASLLDPLFFPLHDVCLGSLKYVHISSLCSSHPLGLCNLDNKPSQLSIPRSLPVFRLCLAGILGVKGMLNKGMDASSSVHACTFQCFMRYVHTNHKAYSQRVSVCVCARVCGGWVGVVRGNNGQVEMFLSVMHGDESCQGSH